MKEEEQALSQFGLLSHFEGAKWSVVAGVDQGLCFDQLICFPFLVRRSIGNYSCSLFSLTTSSFSPQFRTFLLTRFRFARFFQSETCRVCVVCLFFATLSGGERSNTNTPFEKCSNRESEMESASRQYGGLIGWLCSAVAYPGREYGGSIVFIHIFLSFNNPFHDPELIMNPWNEYLPGSNIVWQRISLNAFRPEFDAELLPLSRMLMLQAH